MKSFVVVNKEFCEKLAGWFPRFFKGQGGHKYLLKKKLDEVLSAKHPKKVMDVGSANRPMLERSPDYTLTGLDIEELSGCDDLYDLFIAQSIELPIATPQDLIYSNAVLEHIPDNKAAINSIFNGLNAGGVTVHYLPCKGHPYALILRAVGKKRQKYIIKKLRPWADPEKTGYPTYFDYCSPGQMLRLFRDTGFENIEMSVFYRANSYFKFFFPLYVLITAFENLCEILGIRYFSSGMIISAERG